MKPIQLYFLTGICLVVSACGPDLGTPQGRLAFEEKNRVHVERADEECQIIEGENKGQKFYLNILNDNVLRSIRYPIDYNPGASFPELSGATHNRQTSEYMANILTDIQSDERKKQADGITWRAEYVRAISVDRSDICLMYDAFHFKNGNLTARCVWGYDVKDHRMFEIKPTLFDEKTDQAIPPTAMQMGYYSLDMNRFSTDRVIENAICRPSKVRLR